MKKQMNHKEAVEAAYNAIAELRKSGKNKPSVSEVAERAGIARATLYLKHPDWVEVLEVIKGKTSPRVKLAAVELKEQKQWERNLKRLEEEVERCQEDLTQVRTLGEKTFEKLLDQLQEYAFKAKETPLEREKHNNILKDYGRLKERIEHLEKENRTLRAQSELPPDVRPFSKKEVINVYESNARDGLTVEELSNHALDAINHIDGYFNVSHRAQIPSVVHVMCGNLAAGKSIWIKNHVPLHPGVNLYVDGTHHTKIIRSMIIKRVKKLNSKCLVICCRISAPLETCIKRNSNEARRKAEMAVPEKVIKEVEKQFEEVDVIEQFDEIILVRH